MAGHGLQWRPIVFASIVFSTQIETAFAVEHGFEFAGTVLAVFDEPYEIPITPFSEVFGSLVYESNTTDSYPIAGCDCTGYRHEQINGFWANFAGVKIQADEYIVEVSNDVEVIPVGPADVISWLYPGVAGPDLDTPLLVDGIPYDNGLLRVVLIANPALFSDSSLPEDIDPSDFMLSASFNTFGDQKNAEDEIDAGDADVLFNLQTLEEVPLLESDHDLDGDVDGRDFLIWQRYFGAETGNGDANSDLMVDGEDLTVWEAQYGSVVPLFAGAVAVPEPGAVAFVNYLILISFLRREFRYV